MEIQNKVKLKHYIINEDLWNRSTIETEGFENEIDEIFKFDVTVGQSYSLFIALNGENILDNKLFKKKAKESDFNSGRGNYSTETESNTDSDMIKDKNEDENKSANGEHSGSDNDNFNHTDSEDSDEDMRDDEI